MAETRQQIETRLRAEYPEMKAIENGVERTLGKAEYDATMTEWVENEFVRQLAEDAETARKETRRQVRAARVRLQQIAGASGTFTNAQRDAAIKDVARFLDGTIGALIDLSLIEATD